MQVMATQTYDFDAVLDHRSQRSTKWGLYEQDVVPLWVADMDFKVAPPIVEALHDRVDHGVFGYTSECPLLIEVICERMQRLYNWQVAPEEVVLIPGLVTGLAIVAAAVGQPGDGVLMETPVYGPFLGTPPEAGRFVQAVNMPPVFDDAHTFHYDPDFDRLAAAITRQSRLLYFCNPHNPGGRIYTPEEQTRLAELCARHDITICSDEIHCDLLMDDNTHTPMASLSPEISQRTITLMAPSKTFNLAGLQASIVIIQNAELREAFIRQARLMHAYGWGSSKLNIFAYEAARAAYQYGEDWLQAVLAYLQANRDYARDFIRENMPALRTTHPQATYLMWLDCSALSLDVPAGEFFHKQARVGLNPGMFFGTGYDAYVRLNFACPRATLKAGLTRMPRSRRA